MDGSHAAEVSGETERDADAWLRKANDHRRRGLHENSLRYYSCALEFDRALVPGWVGQVQMLVMLGEYPEAELWAKKSLEIFKNHGDLMAGRAQALARVGDRSVALELADAALRQEGHSAYRWVVRGELLATTRDEMDRHCFDKAVQTDRDWLVPLEIALVYLHYEQPSKALLRRGKRSKWHPIGFTRGLCRDNANRSLGSTDRQRSATSAALNSRHVTWKQAENLPRSPTPAGRFPRGCDA